MEKVCVVVKLLNVGIREFGKYNLAIRSKGICPAMVDIVGKMIRCTMQDRKRVSS